MIRCENCGHTLNSNQRICDVCGKPVAKKKAEDEARGGSSNE